MAGMGAMAYRGQLLIPARANVTVGTNVVVFGMFPTWNVYVGGSIVVQTVVMLLRKTRTVKD